MENKLGKVLSIATLVVAVAVLVVVSWPDNKLGTSFTMQTSNGSYTDSADLYQNVQALTERMASGSQYALLQANSAGVMERVAPSALAGTSWSFDAFYTDALNFLEGYTESTATTNTLTLAMSGETFYLSGATSTYVLPATSIAAGAVYRFVVDGAMTVNQTIVTSDGGNNIEGALIVAGAVVDCDAEDTITFVADGENIGDFVELRSDGDYWFIGSSGALTSSKMTCSTTTP